jgi:hypothetical protein
MAQLLVPVSDTRRERPHPIGENPGADAGSLEGLNFGPTGAAMSPTHTRKGSRLYRYYVSQDVLKRGPGACPIFRARKLHAST